MNTIRKKPSEWAKQLNVEVPMWSESKPSIGADGEPCHQVEWITEATFRTRCVMDGKNV